MPKLICVECEVALKPGTNGVYVAETFQQNTKILRMWCADLWECPLCGYQVVAGFGKETKHHFELDLEAEAEKLKKNRKKVIMCYEAHYAIRKED